MQSNDAIIQDFLNNRTNHLFHEHERIAALRRSVPDLLALDDERAAAKTTLFQEKIAGDADADAHFEAAKQEIADKEKQVLADHHIDADQLAVHYLCDICKDTGYVKGKPCQCLRKVLNAAAFSRYDLTPEAQKENFAAFDLNYYDDTPNAQGRNIRSYMSGLLKRVKDYCDHFDTAEDNFLFTGSPGLGKTFLSNCVACDLIDKGYSVIYISAEHLIDLVRDNFRNHDGGDVRRVYRGLLDSDLLIIDDLGAEYHTQFSDDQLFEIINSRIQRQGRMIISSNLKPKEIQRHYNKRLASRINGYFTALPFKGNDIRDQKKRERRASANPPSSKSSKSTK